MHVEHRHDFDVVTAVKLVPDNVEIPDNFPPFAKKGADYRKEAL